MSVQQQLASIFGNLYPSNEPSDLPELPAPAAAEEVAAPAEADDAEAAPAAEEAPAIAEAPAAPDEYAFQIDAIEGGLRDALSHSQFAAEHLTTERQQSLAKEITSAKALDQEHGLEQRKTGLPIGPSLLTLDPSLLETHGLLHAHELLTAVQRAQAARSAEPSTGKDILAEEAASRPPPHYMLHTRGFESQVASKSALIAGVKSVRALREVATRRRPNPEAHSPTAPTAPTSPTAPTLPTAGLTGCHALRSCVLGRLPSPNNWRRRRRRAREAAS